MPEKREKRTKLDRNEQNAIKSAIGTVLVAEQPSISVSNGLRHSFFTRKSKAPRKTRITNWPPTIACCRKSVEQSLMNWDTHPTTSSVYAHLFTFFQKHAHLCGKQLFRKAILAQLPERLRTEERYRRRIKRLPKKHLFVILASEIASSMVYRENHEADFLGVLQSPLQRSFEDQVELNRDKV